MPVDFNRVIFKQQDIVKAVPGTNIISHGVFKSDNSSHVYLVISKDKGAIASYLNKKGTSWVLRSEKGVLDYDPVIGQE